MGERYLLYWSTLTPAKLMELAPLRAKKSFTFRDVLSEAKRDLTSETCNLSQKQIYLQRLALRAKNRFNLRLALKTRERFTFRDLLSEP